MKKRVVAKAQKIRRRNREMWMRKQGEWQEDALIELDLTAEQLRLRAVKRGKEARDEERARS